MEGSDARLQGLRTPCLLLDKARMLANVARLRARTERLEVPLRPHLKPGEAARRLGPVGPITVSTLAGAR